MNESAQTTPTGFRRLFSAGWLSLYVILIDALFGIILAVVPTAYPVWKNNSVIAGAMFTNTPFVVWPYAMKTFRPFEIWCFWQGALLLVLAVLLLTRYRVAYGVAVLVHGAWLLLLAGNWAAAYSFMGLSAPAFLFEFVVQIALVLSSLAVLIGLLSSPKRPTPTAPMSRASQEDEVEVKPGWDEAGRKKD